MKDYRSNIVLIGMPGCGKTTIGKLLSERLGMKFIDTDCLLEKQEGCTIYELFRQGEESFRNLESKVITALEEENASIIATGGGVVKKESNMESLRKNGIIIYVDRSIEDIAADIDTSTRPLLAMGTDRLVQLYAERDCLYRKYSDFAIKSKDKIEDAVEGIIALLKDCRR